MSFYLIGLNYKQSSFGLRQELCRRRARINALLKEHIGKDAVSLATCNRFEIYGFARNGSGSIKEINIIRSIIPELSQGQIRLGDGQVFKHLVSLACGLESQLKGELEILQQLRGWISQEGFPLEIKNLTDKAISLATMVRLKSGLNSGLNNIATVILYDLKRSIASARAKIIVVGTGRAAELFQIFNRRELELYFAAHKNIAKAKELAGKTGGRALEIKEARSLFETADAIVSATSCPHYIFHKKDFLGLKRQKPFYLYDIALPSDIEPAVAQVKGVILKNLNDLVEEIEEFNQAIADKLNLAERLIEEGYEQDSKDRGAAECAFSQAG